MAPFDIHRLRERLKSAISNCQQLAASSSSVDSAVPSTADFNFIQSMADTDSYGIVLAGVSLEELNMSASWLLQQPISIDLSGDAVLLEISREPDSLTAPLISSCETPRSIAPADAPGIVQLQLCAQAGLPQLKLFVLLDAEAIAREPRLSARLQFYAHCLAIAAPADYEFHADAIAQLQVFSDSHRTAWPLVLPPAGGGWQGAWSELRELHPGHVLPATYFPVASPALPQFLCRTGDALRQALRLYNAAAEALSLSRFFQCERISFELLTLLEQTGAMIDSEISVLPRLDSPFRLHVQASQHRLDYDLGLRVINPVNRLVSVEVLIARDTPIPACKTRVFFTTRPDQTRMVLDVVRARFDHVERLGLLAVGPILRPRRNYPIEVSFQVDASGHIYYLTRDRESGESIQHTLNSAAVQK